MPSGRSAAMALFAMNLMSTGADMCHARSAAAARIVATADVPSGAGDGHVGGISGLDYDQRQRAWLMISDDKSEHAPARAYRLRLRLAGDRQLAIDHITPVTLRSEAARAYPQPGHGSEAVDPEAIRFTPDGKDFLWSSEGDAADGFGASVKTSGRDGRVRALVTLPGNLQNRGRPNRTVEGLSFAPDGALWVAMEAPLRGDGPVADADHAAVVRFTRLRAGRPPQQFAYRVDPVVRAVAHRLSDNGVSEILALDAERLLILERSGEQQDDGTFRFHCRLYLADFGGAPDVADVAFLDTAQPTSPKRLLVDFDALSPEASGNLEGMAWWPGTTSSRHNRKLVLVTDNNFDDRVVTRFVLIDLPAHLLARDPRRLVDRFR